MLPRIVIQDNEPTDISAKARILLPICPGTESADVFEGALLDKTMHRRRPVDWLISLSVHVAIVAALVIVPLFLKQAIDLTQYETTVLAPPPTPFAPPPPPAAPAARPVVQKPRTSMAKLTMPIAIPKDVPVTHEASEPPAEAPDLSASLAGGVPGGQIGGVPGGTPGGILGGTGALPPPPPPPAAAAASNQVLKVGGEVKPPLLLYRTQPKYPVLAQEARIEGDVQIDAIIEKNGNVVQTRAISGPPLLMSAALDAVKQWKYKPTYLNGIAYPVELSVDVMFQFS
jgi:periplasmic protein TonB